MFREIKLILQENKHISIADIEKILHEMNPNLAITENTTLSLKQTMYFYEHLNTVAKPSIKEKSKPVVVEEEKEEIPLTPEQRVKDLLFSFRKQAKNGLEMHNYGLKLKKQFHDSYLQKLIDHLVVAYSIEIEEKRASKKKSAKKHKDKKQISSSSKTTYTPKAALCSHTSSKKHVVMPMTDEERRARNGDKRQRAGYSSTGVRMATHEQIVAMHKEKMEYKKAHPTEKRSRSKMFISVCMGGQNKRY